MSEHIDSNPQNVAPVKEVRSHSNFPLSHYIFGTHRFASYNVNFARDVVAKDVFPLRSSDTIDSYTLKAPLMQDIQKTKEYFFVPKQCILPINWDKIERLPALGDDVDASKVNSTITDFQNRFICDFANLFVFTGRSEITPSRVLTEFFHKLLFTELFFSQGSLLAATGCHLSSLLVFSTSGLPSDLSGANFDTYFDSFVSGLQEYLGQSKVILKVVFDNKDRYNLTPSPGSDDDFSSSRISFHRFLELARDNYNFVFEISGVSSFISGMMDFVGFYFPWEDASESSVCSPRFLPGSDGEVYENVEFSIDRCAAYQIVCAHYFTNDSIDYVHDADLWRQNMLSLCQADYEDNQGLSYSDENFQYNGVTTLYDVLSANTFYNLLNDCFNDGVSFLGAAPSYGYFINLLGWRRSLRFGDYFVGAKARPLAVGDFSVAVNNNAVDVVDITKKISLQRLANNVNRIGNSIKEWYQKIMGSELAYDYHNPMWLASTRSTVYAVKNENTNNANVDELKQVNTSANFGGRDSDFEFTMRPDRNGVVIGITYYDIRRAYMYGIDRMLQHVDRFDGFIPDMQYIGDQDINGNELVAGYGRVHGYTLRNMEYKQFYDEAYGGFAAGKLPGFFFPYRPEFYEDPDSGTTGFANYMRSISPEFIRSRSDEFDQFYISLAGYSNASYFHFIVKTYNELNASRPMVFAPQIL